MQLRSGSVLIGDPQQILRFRISFSGKWFNNIEGLFEVSRFEMRPAFLNVQTLRGNGGQPQPNRGGEAKCEYYVMSNK